MTYCSALLVSAPASGQGKTSITAALAHYHRQRGLRVRVFKTGPDFLDPLILERASGHPVYQLDLWMGGESHCRQLLHEAAKEADLILIEGVMGLFDGSSSSTADLACLFGIPVLAVIDGSAMAQTFGALATGLATYRPELPFAGVFANRVGSKGHSEMLAESLPEGIGFFGWLARNADISLPERHLGLVDPAETLDIDQRLQAAADALQDVPDQLPAPVEFSAPQEQPQTAPLLKGIRIAVARDAAFAFLYRVNLQLLEQLGAQLLYFSPLSDSSVPDADALYLAGGYPELHIQTLANNTAMKQSVTAFHKAAKPIVAECGGMLYLLTTLAHSDGNSGNMVGLLAGHARLEKRLVNLGMHSVTLPEGELRGHTFHHSKTDCSETPITQSTSTRHHGKPEPVYRRGRLTASYLHYYFPSNPVAAASLFLP